MNRSVKMWMSVIVSAFLLFALAACGGGNASPDGGNASEGESGSGNAAEPSGTEKVTLDFVWFTDGVEGEVMQGIISDYEQENPGIDINLVEVAYKDLDTKLKTMIAGGKPPALSRVTNTGNYVNQALDLSSYVGDVEAFKSQFIQSIQPYYWIDDKLIAVPMDVTANGLIYNKTLFEKAGVEVPQSPDEIWTWDEFSESLKTVMEKGGAKYGLVWDFTPHRWSTMLYQFGGSIFNEDATEAAINSQQGVNALEYFVKLHEEGIMPKSVWLGGENPNNLFRSGTVAAHLSGNWMMSNYRDIENFEWGVAYMPIGERRSSVPGGKYVMAFQGTGVEDEAAAFIQYLTSQEVNAKYTSESLFISPRIDNAELDYEYGKEAFAVFANELENTPPEAGRDWSQQEIIPKVANEIKDQISKAVSGDVSAQEALDAAAQKINEAIAEVNE